MTQAHGVFGSIILIFIITQLVLGVYLKLHIHEKTIRPYIVPFHGIIGKAWPVLGWTQVWIPLTLTIIGMPPPPTEVAPTTTDAVRSNDSPGILPGGGDGTVSRTLHHGLCIHRIWHNDGTHALLRRSVAQEDRTQPRMVRQLGYFSVGNRQHLHGAPRFPYKMVS